MTDELWKRYVLRKGADVTRLWEDLYASRSEGKLLYIAGGGFDIRSSTILEEFTSATNSGKRSHKQSELLLIKPVGLSLDSSLTDLTDLNVQKMTEAFRAIGNMSELEVNLGGSAKSGDTVHNNLRSLRDSVISKLDGVKDVVLDISSLPRVVFVTLITSLLEKLVPNRSASNALHAGGVNFQVIVGENAKLDARIVSEDLANDLVFIPGFWRGLAGESYSEWPKVWLTLLGENKQNQIDKTREVLASQDLEVCPILPHPSADPRRGDMLLYEYHRFLEDVPSSNVILANESNPFEVYRQLLRAMRRFQGSFSSLDGVRLVVTPFSSKLMTVGASLACYEMRTNHVDAKHTVDIPYAEPRRYSMDGDAALQAEVTPTVLLLTGDAYAD